MNRIGRLVKTTSFRLSLLYTVVFAGSVGILFAFVFINTNIFAERQIEAAIEVEVRGFQDTYQRTGISGLIQAINRRIDPNIRTDGIYLLTDPNRTRITGNLNSWPKDTVADDLWVNFRILDMERAEPDTADVRALLFFIPGGYQLLVGRDIRDAHDFRAQLLRSLNIGLGLTVALGVFGGFLFSRSIMSRVERITQTCRRIMCGDLSQRIESSGNEDELARLSDSVNEMLDQIERLMRGLREVSDNVAHDLRTPLNRLRSRLEVAVGNAVSLEEKAELQDAIEEADGLLATFSTLLRITRAEASLKRSFDVLELGSIAGDVVDLYRPLAEDKGITFDIDIDSAAKIRGDSNLIAQTIANLADNAVKYTPDGGTISLVVKLEKGRASMTISDTGPSIPQELRGKVFERLYRLESSRTSPGSGLGLSLVAAVAKSHNIEVKLSDNNPGLVVTLDFPDITEFTEFTEFTEQNSHAE